MLKYISRNLTNAEIAEKLSLSEETIKTHVRNLLRKLSQKNRFKVREWLKECDHETEE
jgi:two-component system nitrate/nitrite response regulator NarL